MEKSEKNTIEETNDNEIVELKDEELATITAGAGAPKTGGSEKFNPNDMHSRSEIGHS